MKRKKSKAKLSFILALLFFLFVSPLISAANVGISPASFNFTDVLRGGYSENYVLVSVDSEEVVQIELQPRGDIKEWISFDEEKFTVSKNEPYLLKISINPPKDMPNGEYNGYLRFLTSTFGKDIEGHAVGKVKSSLDLSISVGVTDVEVVRCGTKNVKVSSAEKGEDVVFKFDFENSGNVRLDPNVLIEIWDQDQLSIIKEESFVEDSIFPSAKGSYELRVSSKDLDVGQYWADVSFLDCYQKNTLTFDVLEKGALSAKVVLLDIISEKEITSGTTIPILVNFKNIGEKEVDAEFKGKITLNGKIVDILESELLTVPVSEIETFNFYFTPSRAGKYVVSGRIFYEGKKTFEISSIINVLSGNFNFFILIYIFLIIGIVFFGYKIRKERKTYLKRFRNLK